MKVRMQRRLAGIALASLLLSTTTACGGPTASELGSQLQRDAADLLTKAAGSEADDGVKPTITDDGAKDVACSDGKVKRVYAGSFPFKPNSDVDTTFDLAFKSVLGQLDDERYELTRPPDSDDPNRREFVATSKDDGNITLTVTFTASPAPTFALRGETTCVST
jgi:hypothetical protein